jgi:prohibitin 1
MQRSLTHVSRFPVVAGTVAVLAGFFLLNVTASVGPGERGVVMQFGKVQDRILDEGIHLKMPFITSVKTLSVRVQKTDIEVPAGTQDLQTINTTLSLNWHIDPTRINTIYQQIGDEDAIRDRIIIPALTEVLKAATPKRTAEDILRKRDEIKAEVDGKIKERLATYGVIVDDASLVNVSFSPEFAKAIEEKQIAEQDAKRADYISQRAAKEAQAEVNRAKGQAEAQRLLRQTLTPELLQKQAIEKWNGQFPTVMAGDGALPLINLSPNEIAPKPAP